MSTILDKVESRTTSGTTRTITGTQVAATTDLVVAIFRIAHATAPTSVTSGWTAVAGNGANGANQNRTYIRKGTGAIPTISLTGINSTAVVEAVIFRVPNVTSSALSEVSLGGNTASGTTLSLASGASGVTGPALVLQVQSLLTAPTAWGNWTGAAIPLRTPTTWGLNVAWFDIAADPVMAAGLSWTGARTGRVDTIIIPLDGTLATQSVATGGSVGIVAHQDDDLAMQWSKTSKDLLNPAVPFVAVAYLTAGDALNGWGTYAQNRELGVQSSYAALLGVPNAWVAGTETLAGKTVVYKTLRGTKLRLYFFRLPDDYNTKRVAALWNGTQSTLTALGPSGPTYTKAELQASIQALINLHGPSVTRTMNFREAFGAEAHDDHVAAGKFGHAAVLASSYPASEITFVNQQIVGLPANEDATGQAQKELADRAYAPYDSGWPANWIDDPTANAFWLRNYPVDVVGYPETAPSGTLVRMFGPTFPALTVNTDGTATMISQGFTVDAGAGTVVVDHLRLQFASGTDAAVDGTGYSGAIYRADANGVATEWVASTTWGTVNRTGVQVSNPFNTRVSIPSGNYVIVVKFPRGRFSYNVGYLSTDRVSPDNSAFRMKSGTTVFQSGYSADTAWVDLQLPPAPPGDVDAFGIDVGLYVSSATPTETRTATGTLTLSGTTATVVVQTRTASGTITLSGTAVATAVPMLVRTATGTLNLSGTATLNGGTVTRTAEGVITLSGSSTESAVSQEVRTATGVITLSGTAAIEGGTITRTATGGITLSGSSVEGVGLYRNALGTIVLSGSTVSITQYVRTANGTITLSGTATTLVKEFRTAVGQITLSGTAQADKATDALVRTATGVLNLSGTADSIARYIRTGTGTLTLTGTATVEQRYVVTAQGVLTLSGVGQTASVIDRQAEGIITLTGTAEVIARQIVTAQGTIVLSGTALAYIETGYRFPDSRKVTFIPRAVKVVTPERKVVNVTPRRTLKEVN